MVGDVSGRTNAMLVASRVSSLVWWVCARPGSVSMGVWSGVVWMVGVCGRRRRSFSG